jgi:deoxyhypusine monooxygenase
MGNVEAAQVIAKGVKVRSDSSLMRHELAYILGQMQHAELCPDLISILEDESDDILVRHEAAEALGAIGDISSLEVLGRYKDHPAPEIRETCVIAIDLITWKQGEEARQTEKSRYFLSEDPAPAVAEKSTVAELEKTLLDPALSLFHRYRAMFALRNMNSDASSLALCSGFRDDSALFRHEVAYVLGQMQKKVTIPALSDVLVNISEHRMVRHEAAEALGAIGGEDVENLLAEFQADGEVVVKESCDVALDSMEYWATSGESFLETIESSA